MKIPIDRYSLLGVSMGADNRIILNQLERKLGTSEYSGFCGETIDKRSEILKECSNILLDSEKRAEYDKQYTTKNNVSKKQAEPGTIISKGREIAGLLLLLEAGRYEDCIGMAENLYREQRMNMSYFSSEYKEINRIIDYATLKLAKDLEYKRHYETAAEILERRINSQTVGMGEKEKITQMISELKNLLPFRVLDTLSRDNDDRAHLKGIGLLKCLVKERGGIEADSVVHMNKNEFHAFFKQIRSYLNVQEQVELFEEWSKDGSKAAVFLTCIALTAQGFAQRKPRRIDMALKKLEEMNAQELQPILANMHLLLGHVETATQIFDQHADNDLKEWALKRTKDPLGGLCEWCREWLKRDVLNGYRDIEVEADLESYFSDKDVVEYIENEDRHGVTDSGKQRLEGHWYNQIKKDGIKPHENNLNKNGRSVVTLGRITKIRHNLGRLAVDNILVFLIIAISSCSLLIFKTLSTHDDAKDEPQKVKTYKKKPDIKKEIVGTQEQLNQTLAEWLQIKKQSLQTNEITIDAKRIATPRLLEQLRQETEENKIKGQSQIIDVEIEKIMIRDEAPRKAGINAILKYQDKTINREGGVVTETKSHRFQRRYNFVWNGRRWVIDK